MELRRCSQCSPTGIVDLRGDQVVLDIVECVRHRGCGAARAHSRTGLERFADIVEDLGTIVAG